MSSADERSQQLLEVLIFPLHLLLIFQLLFLDKAFVYLQRNSTSVCGRDQTCMLHIIDDVNLAKWHDLTLHLHAGLPFLLPQKT